MKKICTLYSSIAFILVSIISPYAIAKKKVVLLPFESKVSKKGGKKIRNLIKTLLKGNYEYITKKTIKNEMGDLDFKNLDEAKYKEIGKKFAITAFIGGFMSRKKVRRRMKYVFTMNIISGETGKVAGTKEFVLKRSIPRKKTLEKIAMAYLQALELLGEYIPVVEKKVSVVKQIEDKDEADITDIPIVVRKKKKVVKPSKLPALRAGVSFGFITRNLDFSPSTEPYYKTSAPSFSPFIDVEVYPMMFVDKKSPLSNLGVGIQSFYLMGFESYPANNKDLKIDTTVSHFGFDLMYRLPLMKALLIKPKLGFHARTWSFADENVIDVPSVSYSYLQAALGVEYAVMPELNVEFEFGLMLPMGAGQIVESDYYGQASLMGIKVQLLVGYKIMKNIEVFGSFSYESFSYSFEDYGVRSASSATDVFLKVNLGARYYF
jgi:hypothetical protein